MSEANLIAAALFGFSAGVSFYFGICVLWRINYIAYLETRVASLEAALAKMEESK